MKKYLIPALTLALFSAQAGATPCKMMFKDDGPNTVIYEKKAQASSELSFWLWPDRNAIRLEAHPFTGDVTVVATDTEGTKSYHTDAAYLYMGQETDYLPCVQQAMAASKAGKGLRITVTNTMGGYYDWDACEGKAWALFGSDKVVCEPI